MDIQTAIKDFKFFQQLSIVPVLDPNSVLEDLFTHLVGKVKAMTGSNLIAREEYMGYRAGRKHVLIHLTPRDGFDVYINGKRKADSLYIEQLIPALEDLTGYSLRLR